MIPLTSHRLEIMLPNGTITELAADTSADLTLDAAWAPYIQGSVTIPMPADVAQLDPRSKNARIRLTITKVSGDSATIAGITAAWAGKTLAQLTTLLAGRTLAYITSLFSTPWNSTVPASERRVFDLGIRTRTIDVGARTVTLTLASDEALVQDYALLIDEQIVPSTLNFHTVIESVLIKTIGARLTTATAIDPWPAPATWFRGANAWDYIQSMVQLSNQRIWCDELRQWHLEPKTALTGNARTLDQSITVTDATETITRDADWADAVLVIYRWQDTEGVTYQRFDVAFTTGYTKVHTVTLDTAYPGPGAASFILAQLTKLGITQTVKAVSDYRITPMDTVTLAAPPAVSTSRLINSVQWSWPADEMSLSVRDPNV